MISAVREDAFAEAAAAGGKIVTRKAVMRDIGPILDLINGYAARGVMLPRTEFEMSESIRDFTVVTTAKGDLLGCGALHFYTPTLGEIRSLAVSEQAKTKGVVAQTDTSAGDGGAGAGARCDLRVHLRGGLLPKDRLSRC